MLPSNALLLHSGLTRHSLVTLQDWELHFSTQSSLHIQNSLVLTEDLLRSLYTSRSHTHIHSENGQIHPNWKRPRTLSHPKPPKKKAEPLPVPVPPPASPTKTTAKGMKDFRTGNSNLDQSPTPSKVRKTTSRSAKSPSKPPKSPSKPPKSPSKPPKSPSKPPKSPSKPTKLPSKPPKSPSRPPKPTKKPEKRPKTPSKPTKKSPKKPTPPVEKGGMADMDIFMDLMRRLEAGKARDTK